MTTEMVIGLAIVGPFVATAAAMTVANFFQCWADAGIGVQHRPKFWATALSYWVKYIHNSAHMLAN
jgi:hypothetical protein